MLGEKYDALTDQYAWLLSVQLAAGRSLLVASTPTLAKDEGFPELMAL
jgi:hypothetical protein